MDIKERLYMEVINAHQSSPGAASGHWFERSGGTLGSGARDQLQLPAVGGAVRPAHAGICWRDGRFCLVDYSGRTFINAATVPVGEGRRAALRTGDEIGIGPFRLRVGDRAPEKAMDGWSADQWLEGSAAIPAQREPTAETAGAPELDPLIGLASLGRETEDRTLLPEIDAEQHLDTDILTPDGETAPASGREAAMVLPGIRRKGNRE